MRYCMLSAQPVRLFNWDWHHVLTQSCTQSPTLTPRAACGPNLDPLALHARKDEINLDIDDRDAIDTIHKIYDPKV